MMTYSITPSSSRIGQAEVTQNPRRFINHKDNNNLSLTIEIPGHARYSLGFLWYQVPTQDWRTQGITRKLYLIKYYQIQLPETQYKKHPHYYIQTHTANNHVFRRRALILIPTIQFLYLPIIVGIINLIFVSITVIVSKQNYVVFVFFRV